MLTDTFVTDQHQFGGYFVPATFPMKFNKLNFMGHVVATKSPPNWCCTIIKVSVHTRGHVACRCNIALKHLPATFSCVCTCCNFVPATCPLYTSLLNVASMCTTHVFRRCNMSLQHVTSCLPTFTCLGYSPRSRQRSRKMMQATFPGAILRTSRRKEWRQE